MGTRIEASFPRLRHPATLLLLGAMALSAALIVAFSTELTFLLDDWRFIADRQGFDADTFLQPDNEHFVFGPVVVWQLMVKVFGLTSIIPYKVVSAAMFAAGVGLMYVWVRRRIGDWPALFAAVLVLFCGAAFDDVLWFASITFLGAMIGGLGMLVALDRRDARGDLLACAGLVVSMLFSSLWVAFLAGAAVDVMLRRGERPWRSRAYVVLVPIALYLLWWLGWGHEAESSLSLHNLATTPLYVLDSGAAAVAALLGFAIPVEGISAPAGLDWGRPLFVLLAALTVWRLIRSERIPRSFWVVLAIALAFWIAGGLDVKSGRVAWASRYQYPGGVFVLLIAAELLRGVRFERWMFAPALVVTGAAVFSNVVFLHDSAESYRYTSEIERADLAGLEIVRDHVGPEYIFDEETAGTVYVPDYGAGYLKAVDDYGSPAYDEAELAGAYEFARQPADRVMADVLGLKLAPVHRAPGGACAERVVGADEPASFELPPGGAALRADAPMEVSLQRFSGSYPVHLGGLPTDRWRQLAIPTDRSQRPWQMLVSGDGSVRVCRL